MGFGQAVTTCLRNYVTFSGRASRPEYWWFALFVFLGNFALGLLDGALFGTRQVQVAPGEVMQQTTGVFSRIFMLAMFLPGLAAAWRRMHDSGRSGLHVLYPLIVMVGIGSFAAFTGAFAPVLAGGDYLGVFMGGTGIILLLALLVFIVSPLMVLWWLARPSEPRTNAWGPPPSGTTSGPLADSGLSS